MQIKILSARTDHAAVTKLYQAAADYWHLARETEPAATLADRFFTDAPPNCDPSASHRLGVYWLGDLAGVAELSFGFPEPADAYLGVMILAPSARGAGLGTALLRHIETLARQKGCKSLYLGVLDANLRGRAFWSREGFTPTGKSGTNPQTNALLHRLCKPL